jgi:hypothetical protein
LAKVVNILNKGCNEKMDGTVKLIKKKKCFVN